MLYLVTDRDVLKKKDICEAVEEAILGGVKIVQLREKNSSSKEFYNLALKLKEITSKYNVPLIINDRVDIALASNCDGIHIGQNDLPCAIVRKIIGENKIIGVSAATLEEAIKAEKDGADYIGVGAMFTTSTKLDARAVSLENLIKIKETIDIPVYAIGGINENNIHKLKEAKIDGVAIVSAILAKENIKEACENLRSILNND